MNTENTNPAVNQQPNPGDGAGAATDAANPNGQPATAPGATGGQGDGGNNAGGDAGTTGEPAKPGAAGTGDGQEGEKLELTGAPEAYADYTLPEGFVLEGERKEAAEAFFREANMSQVGAQRAIDMFTKLVSEDAAVQQQAMEAAVAKQRDDWSVQAKAELGDKYDETVRYATTAVQATQNPKLLEAFNEHGWGNHPELIKAFAFFGRLGRDSGIDGVSGSAGAAATPQRLADRMYNKA